MKGELLYIQVRFLSMGDSYLEHTYNNHIAMLQDSRVLAPHHSNTYEQRSHNEHNRHKGSQLLRHPQNTHNNTIPLASEKRTVVKMLHN